MAPARNSASDAAPNVENGGMATHLVPFLMILADFGGLAHPGGGILPKFDPGSRQWQADPGIPPW